MGNEISGIPNTTSYRSLIDIIRSVTNGNLGNAIADSLGFNNSPGISGFQLWEGNSPSGVNPFAIVANLDPVGSPTDEVDIYTTLGGHIGVQFVGNGSATDQIVFLNGGTAVMIIGDGASDPTVVNFSGALNSITINGSSQSTICNLGTNGLAFYAGAIGIGDNGILNTIANTDDSNILQLYADNNSGYDNNGYLQSQVSFGNINRGGGAIVCGDNDTHPTWIYTSQDSYTMGNLLDDGLGNSSFKNFNNFKMSVGSGSGLVLSSDATGNGAWSALLSNALTVTGSDSTITVSQVMTNIDLVLNLNKSNVWLQVQQVPSMYSDGGYITSDGSGNVTIRGGINIKTSDDSIYISRLENLGYSGFGAELLFTANTETPSPNDSIQWKVNNGGVACSFVIAVTNVGVNLVASGNTFNVNGTSGNRVSIDDLGNILASGTVQIQNASHMYSGSGAPNTSTASVGDTYTNTSGTPGNGTCLYYCTAHGAPDTWVGIA